MNKNTTLTPVEVVPARIVRMANFMEKQARGECAIVSTCMTYGKSTALRIAQARDVTPNYQSPDTGEKKL